MSGFWDQLQSTYKDKLNSTPRRLFVNKIKHNRGFLLCCIYDHEQYLMVNHGSIKLISINLEQGFFLS